MSKTAAVRRRSRDGEIRHDSRSRVRYRPVARAAAAGTRHSASGIGRDAEREHRLSHPAALRELGPIRARLVTAHPQGLPARRGWLSRTGARRAARRNDCADDRPARVKRRRSQRHSAGGERPRGGARSPLVSSRCPSSPQRPFAVSAAASSARRRSRSAATTAPATASRYRRIRSAPSSSARWPSERSSLRSSSSLC